MKNLSTNQIILLLNICKKNDNEEMLSSYETDLIILFQRKLIEKKSTLWEVTQKGINLIS